jgi:hypothetical protein
LAEADMSEQDLREMIAFASEGSEVSFKKTGMVAPLWFGVTASGESFDLEPPHPDKDFSIAMIRAYFALRNVVRYVSISEAWTIERALSDDEVAWIATHGGVAAHPDRIEVVMINGEDRDAGLLTAQRRIIRPPRGRAYLAPLEIQDRTDIKQSSGRMVGLLPARGTRH